jgi:ubiquinone biosynthesis protein
VTVVSVLATILVELPLAVATTLLALRLLGVRRSWLAATIAGTVGWVTGNLLALQLAGWDPDGLRLSLTTLVFSAVFTIVAALGLDLMARPGTLARGDRAGLVVRPRPWREIRRRLAPYVRYRELLGIARRNGLVGGVGRRHRRAARSGAALGVAVRNTLEQSGLVFVKLGQVASTRADLIPAEIRDALKDLQNAVEPAPPEAMKAVLDAELGGPAEQFFAEFDWEPVGTASIAQAYAARLTTGEAVVVKVQRPGVERLVRRDMAALLRLARTVERRTPQGQQLHVTELMTQFAESVERELDFRLEAANAATLAAATAPDAGIRIPRVHQAMSTRRVLVEERLCGVPVSHSDRIDELGLDAGELADRLVRATIGHVLHGHYHADMHPGNVLVLDDGTLGLIDFGSVGHLEARERSALLQLTVAAMDGDAAGVKDALETITVIGDDVDDVVFERAIAHFLSEHLAVGQAMDASTFTDLVALLASFDVRVPAAMTTFVRALVVLDGTVRLMAPEYQLVDGIRRLIHAGALRPASVGAVGPRDVALGLVRDLSHLRKLPAQLDRIATLASRGELRTRVALFSTERDARVVTTLVNRVVLALVGGLLTVGAVVLLATSQAGGVAAGRASMMEAFGLVGLGMAAVLLFRVVAAIVRDGGN